MSYPRANQEGTFFLTGRVAQAVGNYLARLERYEEAREEYQQASAAYKQVLQASPDFIEAQKNQEIVLRKLKELPARQKSSAAYRLELLFSDTANPLRPRTTISPVNLSQWLHNIFDEGWQAIEGLFAPGEYNLAHAYALRSGDAGENSDATRLSPTETLSAIITQLRGKEGEIPSIAAGGYRDFHLGDNSLRLYALTWANTKADNLLEWTLLLILGTQSGSTLPQGLKFQVSDLTEILVEQTVEPESQQTYFYARLVGTEKEQFLAIIASELGEILIMPPFSFMSE